MSTAFEKIFESANTLPQIPKVVQELIDSLKDEDVDLGTLVAKVRQDQVIAAKVLRLANSSYYGSSGKVKTIDDAVTLIGLNAFRTLIIASGVVSSFKVTPGLDFIDFWKRSMLVANVARALARHIKADSEAAFTAGLMHGIGQLLLHQVFPDTSAKVSQNCKGTSVGERMAVERTLLHIDHCTVGAELAKRWRFPEEIRDAILHYTAPEKGGVIAKTVFVAVMIGQEIAAGKSAEEIFTIVPANCLSDLNLNKDWFVEREDVFRLLLAEAASLL